MCRTLTTRVIRLGFWSAVYLFVHVGVIGQALLEVGGMLSRLGLLGQSNDIFLVFGGIPGVAFIENLAAALRVISAALVTYQLLRVGMLIYRRPRAAGDGPR